MRKSCRAVSAIFAVLVLLTVSCFSAFSAENHYYIEELNLSFDLPDDMLAITKESPETDRYFSIFGLDYPTTMNNFESNHIYLQGMYEDSSRIFTVTMQSDGDSKSVGNYSDLSDEQLLEVQNSFLSEKEYTSCTVQRYNSNVFMELQFKTQTDGETVTATQSNTVIDGNNITFTLQPAKGSVLTDQDYQVMSNILQSVEFSGHGIFDTANLIANPIFWIAVSAVAIFIVVVVALIIRKKVKNHRKKIKREEKRIRNQEILQELAAEYSSQTVVIENNITQPEPARFNTESAEDIITQFRNSRDFQEINKKKAVSAKEEVETPEQEILVENISVIGDNTDDTITEEETQEKQNIPFKAEDQPALRIVTPDDETEENEEAQNKEDNKLKQKSEAVYDNNFDVSDEDDYQSQEEYFEQYYEEYDEDEEYDDEYIEDIPVVAREESFDQSEDYFDDALDNENDIYSRETVDDEDNYEKPRKINVSKVDKDAVKTKAKTAGAVALNGTLIFLNGVKSFFIHLGYFCTNLFRLIKKNIKKRQKRKAEMLKRRQQEEAKRRREENLKRKQQNISKDANGLVKVRSRREYADKSNRR